MTNAPSNEKKDLFRKLLEGYVPNVQISISRPITENSKLFQSALVEIGEQDNVNHPSKHKNILRKLLFNGYYVGYGFADIHAQERTLIFPSCWYFLELDINNNSASGEGVKYHGLMFLHHSKLTEHVREIIKQMPRGDSPSVISSPPITHETEDSIQDKEPSAPPTKTRRKDPIATSARNTQWRERGEVLLSANQARAIKDIAAQIAVETQWAGEATTVERSLRRLKPST